MGHKHTREVTQTEPSYKLGTMESMATAALYAMENQEMVENHFDDFSTLIKERFEDDAFIARVHSLKKRGRITDSVRLPKSDKVFCFADCIWFKIERTQRSMESYFFSIGINMRKDRMSPFTISKIYLHQLVGGELDPIRTYLISDKFAEDTKPVFCQWVYDCCNESILQNLEIHD